MYEKGVVRDRLEIVFAAIRGYMIERGGLPAFLERGMSAILLEVGEVEVQRGEALRLLGCCKRAAIVAGAEFGDRQGGDGLLESRGLREMLTISE